MAPTARSTSTPNARGRATAQRIERAAVAMAAERGADAVTVDAICVAVGVSQRTFFNHFATKDEVLLGTQLPEVDEERARGYLADGSIGVLRGALGLIRLPRELADDPPLAMARFRVLQSSPALAQRQALRFMSVVAEVEQLVFLKLGGRYGDTRDEPSLRAAARAITSLAGALMMKLPTTDETPMSMPLPGDPARALDDLEWMWNDLI